MENGLFSFVKYCLIILIFVHDVMPEESPSAHHDEPAVLLRGPYESRGIEFLEPNVLPVFKGYYLLGDANVEVIFTRSEILIAEDWNPFACNSLRVSRGPDQEYHTFYYSKSEEYSVFFRFPIDTDVDCKFIEVFINRLDFFLHFTENPFDVPFPAILNLES